MQFLWPDGLFSVYAVSCKFLFITLLISLKSKLAILILIFLEPTFLLYKSLKEICTVGLEFKHKGVPMLLLHQKQKTKKKTHTFFLLALVSAVPGCHQLLDENQTLQETKEEQFW